MTIDAEAAIWIWNNLYLKRQQGEGNQISMKDELDTKFKMQDADMKQKTLMARRGYKIDV